MGDRWKVTLHSDLGYEEIFGDSKRYGTQAMTVYNHKEGVREIHLSQSGLTESTIRHELMHAYLSYRDYSTMSYGSIEEDICEVLDSRLVTIGNQAKRIYRKLK